MGPIIKVVDTGYTCLLGEAPHWSAVEQTLYYVDIYNCRVLRYDPSTGINSYVTVYGQKDHVSFVVPIKGKPNEFMISRSREVCRLHWDVEQEREDDGTMPRHWVVVLAKVDKGLISNKFNEGKCDPRGRLWAGTIPGVEGDFSSKSGSVFMITPKESDRQTAIVEFKFDNVDLSNGLEWSLGGNTMYYIDSLSLSIEAFDYDEASGNISKRRTLFDFKANKAKGIPDGMTVDNRGHLWVACFGASQVIEIDPQNGKQVSAISFDGMANNLTSVAFGGSDLKDLYVTSARIGSPANFGPQDGQLFVVRNTGAQGLPGRDFNPSAGPDCY